MKEFFLFLVVIVILGGVWSRVYNPGIGKWTAVFQESPIHDHKTRTIEKIVLELNNNGEAVFLTHWVEGGSTTDIYSNNSGFGYVTSSGHSSGDHRLMGSYAFKLPRLVLTTTVPHVDPDNEYPPFKIDDIQKDGHGQFTLTLSAHVSFENNMMLLQRDSLHSAIRFKTTKKGGYNPLILEFEENENPAPRTRVGKSEDVAYGDPGACSSVGLPFAVLSGDNEKVKACLSAGVNVNTKDGNGLTPLMSAVVNDKKDIVKTLLSAGANVNAVDNTGQTALMLGILNSEIAKLLLSTVTIDVNAKDRQGRTVLMKAVLMNKEDIVRKLTTFWALDINAADNTGQTALSIAQSMNHPNLVYLLRQAGAKNHKNNVEQTR